MCGCNQAAGGYSLAKRRTTRRLGELLSFWYDVMLLLAKIGPLHLHDLRHSFTSHTAIQQENTPMIARLLGHRGTDNNQRHIHPADQPALDAAEPISGLLWQVLNARLPAMAHG